MKIRQSISFWGILVMSVLLVGMVSMWFLSRHTLLGIKFKEKLINEKAPTTLIFENIGTGDSLTSNIEAPTLIIAGNKREAEKLAMTLGSDTIEAEVDKRLLEINYKKAFVVAAFRGQTPESSFDISIQKILRNPEGVDVIVEFTVPESVDPETGGILIGAAAIAHPYHIVSIPREAIDLRTRREWKMLTKEGKLLAQTFYP